MKTDRAKRRVKKPLGIAVAQGDRLARWHSDIVATKTLNKAVTAIENAYLSSATLSIEALSDKVLKEAKLITGSRYGFAAYIDPATGWMVSTTLTRDIWKKCRVKNKSIIFKKFNGLWGWVLQHKRPILTNNAPADPRSSGVPKGHIKIEKFLAAPAVFNKKLTGMIALANSGRDYTASDLAAVNKLSRVYAIIIQRKFAEDKFKESAEKQSAIIDSSRDIIYTVNTAGIVTYMSRQAGKYGYSPDEITGRHVLEFAHPDDRDLLKRALANALKTGHTLPILPYRIKKKDGSYFYVEQKSGVIIKNGKPFMISCVARDVTEHIRLENRIKENEEKYRTLFENANAAILLADAGTGTLLDANRQAERLFGRTKRELIGMDRLKLHPPDEAKHYKKHFQDHVKHGAVNFSEAVIVRKDGTPVPVLINAAVTRVGGRKVIQGIFEDITERRRIENALKLSEQKFRDLTETTPDWIWEVDANGVYTYASPRIKELLGYEASELIGKKPFDLMPPEEAKRVGAVFKSYLIRKAPFRNLENINRHKDGRLIVVETNGNPILNEKGELTGYRGIDRDITRRKHMEEALRASENKYRSIVETTDTGFLILDREGRVVDANQEYVRLTGRRQLSEILGKSVLEWTAPYEREKNAEAVAECARSGCARNLLLDYSGPDGRITTVEVNATVEGAGESLRIVSLCRDITERRRLENILKENEELMRRIFDTAKDIIFIKDIDGVYITANKACADIFLLTPEEMPGKTDADIFPPDIADKVFKEDAEVFRTGKTLVYNKEITMPSGKYYLNGIKTPLRNAHGEITGVLGVVRDITKIKKMESELALTRAREAVSRETRPIAHDFNNALAAINGYATLIDEDLDTKNPIKPEIAMIIKGVQRAAKITAKLQKYARNPKIRPEKKQSA
ncbi:MAG: PAS domain S-box protein [Elusimicrobia bacterium]|nr:PAS domain S-box protein [Elusimicrobiota bacterium]